MARPWRYAKRNQPPANMYNVARTLQSLMAATQHKHAHWSFVHNMEAVITALIQAVLQAIGVYNKNKDAEEALLAAEESLSKARARTKWSSKG